MQRSTRPILFENKEDCCGCSACFAICPKHAIVMEPDEEGFLYPSILEELCIRCYQCEHVCPLKRFEQSSTEGKNLPRRQKNNPVPEQEATSGHANMRVPYGG